ncbi:WecB/TagA/CpsF family glycosyltransferase [Thalassotalea sp. PLHSN55]|uniref:WecB/TagA/CpsF family glycosyltransferase n=1 Tax=Thalassotalea sp. PLHSN55 TaxID=3435888 RepID=UPI003F86CC88
MNQLVSSNSQLDTHRKKIYQGSGFDHVIAVLLLIITLPVMLVNTLIAIVSNAPVFTTIGKTDALGRAITLRHFNKGIFCQSALLLDILQNKLAFCGISLKHQVSFEMQDIVKAQFDCKPALFSLYDLHQQTGLAVQDADELLLKQLTSTKANWVALFTKSVLCLVVYRSNKALKRSKRISLFGLPLNNIMMQEAVHLVTHTERALQSAPKLTFFINVNSINLALKNATFYQQLQQADHLLADGSGMRLAAKSAGYLLEDNNNGTDMLPHLCKSCIAHKKSLFLLGSAPGVADKTAKNLQAQFRGLNIAGTAHGYFSDNETAQLIADINDSGCDILLVAMGSPMQEQWLLAHKHKLHCQSALAVGGLFDFYSGRISRSPMWLRELGLEWLWRLAKEPVAKFNRYVIGNPLFLFRIFILGLARKGVK